MTPRAFKAVPLERWLPWGLFAVSAWLGLAPGARAWGQAADAAPPTGPSEAAPAPSPRGAPVPPQAESPPLERAGGGYCYDGPHPTDNREAAGPRWDQAPGRHVHFYPPLDPRLFVLRGDCYHFAGDPTDFGFDGNTQPYYGAHPIPGGGWCYMVGGHQHAFAPFGAGFVTVGPWLHWQGTFDATFWAYWPYFSAFYKDLYPRYYGGGQWRRQRHVAPALPPGAWTHGPRIEGERTEGSPGRRPPPR
ncbi:MAG: hypothetical protein KA712_03890 [Myxococcales bacterium]|nr:hypothetical protein [Myxococcales bacterium]